MAIGEHFAAGNRSAGQDCSIEQQTGHAVNYMHDSELLSDRIHQRLIQKHQNTASGIFHARLFSLQFTLHYTMKMLRGKNKWAC